MDQERFFPVPYPPRRILVSATICSSLIWLSAMAPMATASDNSWIVELQPPKSEAEFSKFHRTVESLKLRDKSQLPQLRQLLDKLLDQRAYRAASMVGKKIQAILCVNQIADLEIVDELKTALRSIPNKHHGPRLRLALALAYLHTGVLGDDRTAIYYSEQCLEEAKATDQPGITIRPRMVMATIYSNWNQYDEAIKVYDSILESAAEMDESSSKQAKLVSYSELAHLHTLEGNNELADHFYRLAIESSRSQSVAAQVLARVNYANHLVGRSKLKTAESQVSTAESLIGETEAEGSCSEVEQNISILRAQIELANGNAEVAKSMLAEQVPEGTCRDSFFEVKRDVHVELGEFEEALLAQSELLRQANKSNNGVRLQAARTASEMLDYQRASLKKATDFSHKIRNLVIGFAIAAVAFSCVFFRVDSNRRIQTNLHEQERRTNARLSKLVEEKTASLVRRMEEQASLEQELERKRRHEALGQLTGGVAHDINNVLQVIMASNEMIELAGDSDLNEAQMSLLDASNESVNMAASIVQQLLAFARRQRLMPETLKAADVLHTQRPLLKAALGDRISLRVLIDCPNTNIRVDSAQMTSSLLNLLSNSAHAMKETGGEITIETREVHVEPGQLKDVKSGEYMRIDLTDSGRGMDHQTLTRCCEPFFSTKPPHEGTGLGLSTVQGFVRQSGGELTVSSSRGEGTTVSMYFPIDEQETIVMPKRIRPTRSHLGTMRTLLVDDSELVRQVLVTKLEAMGMEVVAADSGDAALKLLQSDRNIQFVLSDIHMPGSTDGRSLREKLRHSHPGLPVILMTGYDDSSNGTDSEILRKPFTDEELLETFGSVQLAHAG